VSLLSEGEKAGQTHVRQRNVGQYKGISHCQKKLDTTKGMLTRVVPKARVGTNGDVKINGH